MPIIALASSKGGVGKTMTTVILANTLAKKGLTVKVIDAEKRDHSNVDTWFSASKKTRLQYLAGEVRRDHQDQADP